MFSKILVMPTFAFPGCLLLLLTVPPLLYFWWRRGRAALRYSDTRLLSGLPTGRARRAQRWGLNFRAAGLVFLILALAGPRWPDLGTRIPTEGIAIAIVLDVSASMNERDVDWQGEPLTRLEAVKRVFRLFVAGGEAPGSVNLAARPNDLIGLVVFATRPETACPLTLDHAALLKILDAEEARTVATEATTNPGDAIAWSLVALEKAPALRKVIVFLTDGESNVPAPALTPRQAAQLAGNLEIPIYAIGAGGEVNDKEAGARARASLEDVARITKGRHFLAADGAALAAACAEIDKLERTPIEGVHYRRYHEGYLWCAVLALVSWLVILGLESTRWRRIP